MTLMYACRPCDRGPSPLAGKLDEQTIESALLRGEIPAAILMCAPVYVYTPPPATTSPADRCPSVYVLPHADGQGRSTCGATVILAPTDRD